MSLVKQAEYSNNWLWKCETLRLSLFFYMTEKNKKTKNKKQKKNNNNNPECYESIQSRKKAYTYVFVLKKRE